MNMAKSSFQEIWQKRLVSRKVPEAGATSQIAIAPAPALNLKRISGSF